ncbi:MAG: 5-oxoprolinase subunit PxpA [Bacillota bacterium]
MKRNAVDLNCDMGENFGLYRVFPDHKIMRYITSANLACAYHAGDPHVMRETVLLAKEHGVAVGAHVGFPDLIGFGRRRMECTPQQVKDYVTYQVGALMGFCRSAGISLQHVKPHGQMYMMAGEDRVLSEAIVEAILELDEKLILFTHRAFVTYDVAIEKGLRVINEFYGDRGARDNGVLIFKFDLNDIGGSAEAMARRIARMVKENKVVATGGKEIDLVAESVCIHSDTPGALDFFEAVHKVLQEEEIEITAVRNIVQ